MKEHHNIKNLNLFLQPGAILSFTVFSELFFFFFVQMRFYGHSFMFLCRCKLPPTPKSCERGLEEHLPEVGSVAIYFSSTLHRHVVLIIASFCL